MKDSVVRAFVRLGKFPLLPEAVYAAVAVMVFITVGFMSHWNGRDGGFGVGQPELVAMLSSGGQEVSQLLEDQAPPRNVLAFFPYIVVKGDTISEIAHRFGLNQGSIISCNAVEKARALQIGTVLQIPNMDGIMHTLKARDSLEKLAESYDVPPESILESNNISELSEAAGGKVFIPEAKLPTIELRRVWGELFRYPARGWISSPYGWRTDPISGERRFHNGIDIAGPHGSAVIAALDGRVIETGYNDTAGNYVILSHLGGYTTFYAHLSVIHVRQGQWVQERQRIGNVGNSGYSTGSHLHFTVSRWGKPVNPSLLLH